MATQKNLKVGITADSSGFTKGLDQATRSLKGFDQQAGQLLGKTVAQFASLTVAIGATKKVLNDIKDSTQLWGDRWAQTVEGMQMAYGTLIRQLSSGEGWSSLLVNMSAAYDKGKELAALIDEVFERKISFSYAEAEGQKFISEMQLIMRDSSKSDDERKKAAQAIIDKEKELAGIKREVWQQEADYNRQKFQQATGLNDEQTDFLLKNYNINRQIINQARDYMTERARLEKQIASASAGIASFGGGFGGALYSGANAGGAQQALANLESSTSDAIKRVAELVHNYDKSNDDLVNGMVEAEIAVINIDTEANRASTRATAMLGSLNKDVRTVTQSTKDLSEQLRTVQDLGWGSTFNDLNLMSEWEKLPGLEGSAQRGDAGLALSGASAELKTVGQDLRDFTQLSDQAAAVIQSSLVSSFQELADVLAGIDGGNLGSVLSALLTPLADFAISAGTIILTTGAALESLKKAMASLFGGGPAGAIAAGAALVAIGVGAKAGLMALTNNGGSYSSASYVASSSGSTASGDYDTRSMSVNVTGTLVADGSKLVAVINNTNKKKEYTT